MNIAGVMCVKYLVFRTQCRSMWMRVCMCVYVVVRFSKFSNYFLNHPRFALIFSFYGLSPVPAKTTTLYSLTTSPTPDYISYMLSLALASFPGSDGKKDMCSFCVF